MKKIVAMLAVAVILAPLHALAMAQPIFGAINYGGVPTATRYYPFMIGTGGTAGTTSNGGITIAADGTVSDLRVRVGTAPGTGASWTFSFTIGSVTDLSCTISGTDTTCEDLVDEIAVTAGVSEVFWQIVPSAGTAPAGTSIYISAAFTGDNPGEAVLAGQTNTITGSGGTKYFPIYGTGGGTTTPMGASTTMPTSGTVDRLYGDIVSNLAVGQSYSFTLYKNGVATSLTCAVADVNAECEDLTHSVSYAAGDSIAMEVSPTGSPGNRGGRWGLRFRPTVDGESPIFMREDAFSTVTRYHPIQGDGTRSQTEDPVQATAPIDFTLKNLYAAFAYGSPDVGTRTVDVRKNGATESLGVVFDTTSSWETDLTDTVSFTAGDRINYLLEATGSPTNVALLFLSATAYVDPGGEAPAQSLPYRIYNLGQMLLNGGTFILQ